MDEIARKGRKQGGGKQLALPIGLNLTKTRENTYLFRNDAAHSYFNAFKKRPKSECYYFEKKGTLGSRFETEKMEEYLNRWGWRQIFENKEQYSDLIVRAFYANMIKTGDDEVPWGFHTYVCGREIDCTLPKMAEYLGLVNDGEEVYLNNRWLTGPTAPSIHDYYNWFRVPRTTPREMGLRGRDRIFLSTKLPSIHRLAFAFLNYIVTPKGGFKTNVEFHNMFYLRHLIDGSNRFFNIPFVIISHMRAAYTDSRRILPYGNLITTIIKANGIDLVPMMLTQSPFNLWYNLATNRWKIVSHNEETHHREYVNKGKPVDKWVAMTGAKPNQYWDPALNEQEGDSSNDEAGSSHAAPSDDFQRSVLTALANLSTQNTEIKNTQQEILANQVSIKETLTDHGTRLGRIETNHEEIIRRYGAFYTGEYRPFYDDYLGLKERYVTRFGGDDDDLNTVPGEGGTSGAGQDYDDIMED
jgi:hypothetical protein